MLPNAPRYVSPKERAENRARYRAWAVLDRGGDPGLIALMMFGYSDQAPHWLREFTVALDATLGFPILWLVKTVLTRELRAPSSGTMSFATGPSAP